MKTNEIAGVGNHYTAKYWEYDPRVGRRWNKDPKPNPSISDYVTFLNNPIKYNDPSGDIINVWWKNPNGRTKEAGENLWQQMVKYLRENGLGNEVDYLINSPNVYGLEFTDKPTNETSINLDKNGNLLPTIPTIHVSPYWGLQVSESYTMSPLEIIYHEVIHLFLFAQDPCQSWEDSKKWDPTFINTNINEGKIIRVYEPKAAVKIGVGTSPTTPIRKGHGGKEVYKPWSTWRYGGGSFKKEELPNSGGGGSGGDAGSDGWNVEVGDGKGGTATQTRNGDGSTTTTPTNRDGNATGPSATSGGSGGGSGGSGGGSGGSGGGSGK